MVLSQGFLRVLNVGPRWNGFAGMRVATPTLTAAWLRDLEKGKSHGNLGPPIDVLTPLDNSTSLHVCRCQSPAKTGYGEGPA